MTKQEALTFLELTEQSGETEIKERLAERLAHYEMLSEKAPSDFLRRLNLRNLEKVKVILKESAQWSSFAGAAEPIAAEITPEELVEEDPLTVYIVPSLKEAVIKKAENKELAKKRGSDEPAGWLICHTENKPATTYPVQAGKNFAGRKMQVAMKPFIVIEGDDFISRLQCVIYAEEENPLEFYISDPSSFNNGKTSSNGTFVNGNSEPVTQKIKLADGDTIQMGVTKFVIRFNTASIEKLTEEVLQGKYTDTVIINT